MRKRGPKAKQNLLLKWSSNFAYAIGLIVSDGCLSKDGRHIDLTSKDLEMIVNFQKALNTNYLIGRKSGGKTREKEYFMVQFSNVRFYNFLCSIGIMPAKSKTITEVDVPDKYFFDFLRGLFDGDGTIYSYWDPRWKSSFMYYVSFVSASEAFVAWLRFTIERLSGVFGHVKEDGGGSTLQLTYAKRESLILLKKMYRHPRALSLSRKRLKSKKILGIVGERL